MNNTFNGQWQDFSATALDSTKELERINSGLAEKLTQKNTEIANTAIDTGNKLAALVGETVDAPVGPVQVGTVETLTGDGAVSEIAKHYLDAFTNGKTVLPYFRGPSS